MSKWKTTCLQHPPVACNSHNMVRLPKPTATTSGSSFVLQTDSSTTNAKFKTNAKHKDARNSKIWRCENVPHNYSPVHITLQKSCENKPNLQLKLRSPFVMTPFSDPTCSRMTFSIIKTSYFHNSHVISIIKFCHYVYASSRYSNTRSPWF